MNVFNIPSLYLFLISEIIDLKFSIAYNSIGFKPYAMENLKSNSDIFVLVDQEF